MPGNFKGLTWVGFYWFMFLIREETSDRPLMGNYSSASKEDSVDRDEAAPYRKLQDYLNHVAAKAKSHDKYSISFASSKDKGKIQILAHGLNKFSLNGLKRATGNFKYNVRSRLGGGEFGEVFEGEFGTKQYASSWFAFDGISRIAIKRFRHYKIQHRLKENDVIEFVDLTFLSKFNHPNLVKVLGYCFEDETLFLIYEFMENGSLDSHLFTTGKIPLPWKTRVKIALGIAEGLLFLHTTENKVDDFSIKIHQILLDKNFNAKISDFESAKIVYGGSFKEIEHWNNSEYEGIIHSFGVLLIQIITGERISNIDIANLRQNMWNPNGEIRKGSLRRVLDPRLPNKDDTTIMEAMKLALDCVSIPYFPLKKAADVLTQIYTHIIKSDVYK
ncbi:probable serine/threonine-protein kinase PBL11 isoform X1 [Helianthus annuus]|uniref:Putative tyrosine-protein kinase, Fes/Fps type n=1 Tax=Helianthus annuus TaxID=4232 RepID=A0A251UUX2_HELAN|nr:probable serine/threonine-protein kinase PBL11 isoform X1 [Helianthus annuus]